MSKEIANRYKDKLKNAPVTKGGLTAPEEINPEGKYPVILFKELFKIQVDENGRDIEHKEGNKIQKLECTEPMVVLDVFISDEIFKETGTNKCYLKADIGTDEDDINIYTMGKPAFIDKLKKTKDEGDKGNDDNIGLPTYIGFKQVVTKKNRVAWVIYTPNDGIPKFREVEE